MKKISYSMLKANLKNIYIDKYNPKEGARWKNPT